MKQTRQFSILVKHLFCIWVLLPIAAQAQAPLPSSGKLLVKYARPLPETQLQQLHQSLPGKPRITQLNPQLEAWEWTSQSTGASAFARQEAPSLAVLPTQHPDILYIEPDYLFQTEALPNDPFFRRQWGLHNSGQTGGISGADIQVLGQWENLNERHNLVTGIIDTGVDWGHEDLVENIWQNLAEDADGDGRTLEQIGGVWQLDPGDLDHIDQDGNGYVDDLIGWDFVNNDNNPFDDNGHGTHVAGIMAASSNNGKGITGVSHTTCIMALKAFDEHGTGAVLSIAPAIAYARKMGAQLTNNSWGGPAESQAVYDELLMAGKANMLSICAAGNHSSNNSHTPVFPGSYDLDHIICVGASTHRDSLASFSNHSHERVDLMAPGQDIFSTLPGNAYGYRSGTSMATPFVSGAIGLVWAADTSLSNLQVRDLILSSATRKPGFSYSCVSGARLSVLESMRVLRAFCQGLAEQTLGKQIRAFLSEEDYIWTGTHQGLFRHNKRACGVNAFTRAEGLAHDRVCALAQDAQGRIWVATDGGLSVYDGSQWTTFNKNNSALPHNTLLSLLIDETDTKWVGTQKHGLVRYDGQNWTSFNTRNSGLPNNLVSEMVKDDQANLWIATGGGIAVYDQLDWGVYTTKNSPLPDNQVHCITLDSTGNIWAGTNNGGLVRYDGHNWKVFNINNSGLPSNTVTSVKIDQNHIVWVATSAGVAKYDGSQWIIYANTGSVGELPDPSVLSLLVDVDNNTWAGTERGMFLFSSDALVSSFTADKTPCQSQTITFTNSSIGGKKYTWLVDGVPQGQEPQFSYSFEQTGTHTVSLVAHNLYATDTLTQEFSVAPLPELNLPDDTVACARAMVLESGFRQGGFRWMDLTGQELGTLPTLRVDKSQPYVLQMRTVCQTLIQDTISVILAGDCVWPGDVTADGMVNMLDFLALGLANGQTGPARVDTRTDWHPVSATNWPTAFDDQHQVAPAVNIKHADCNGDGQVSFLQDAAVIMKNAGYSHQPLATASGPAIGLRVEPLAPVVMATDTFMIMYDLIVDQPDPLDSVFGIAFSIDYNLPLSQTPLLSFDDSLTHDMHFGVIAHDQDKQGTNTQFFARRRRMDIGLVRTRRTVRRLRSRIARLGVIVVLEDIQDGLKALDFTSFSITSSNLVVIDGQGRTRPVIENASHATSTVLIQSPSPVLPVSWVGFSASLHQNQVDLLWEIDQEQGQESYYIQRSLDGMEFESLGRIHARKQGQSQQAYRFTDSNPRPGLNYYRIMMEDAAGNQSFSEVETVLLEPLPLSVSVYPNPSSGPMDVRIVSGIAGVGTLRLINSLGKVFIQRDLKIQPGSHILPLDAQGFPAGIYYLEIATEDRRQLVKFKRMP